MDPDVSIYQRQMQEEVKEKYQLYKRIDELTKELEELRKKVEKLEKK